MRSFWKIREPKDFAKALKAYRHHRLLTQAELAELIGVRQATISAFEHHPECAKLETFFKIFNALKLDLTMRKQEQVQSSEQQTLTP